MCKLKSAIILKDRVFCPEYDSHTQMLEELKIKDTKENAERLFVRAELSPADGDIFSDIGTWKMKVDQDIVPEWFVAEAEKPRLAEAVKEWTEKTVFVGKRGLVLKENKHYFLKDSTAELWGYSTAKLYDNSTAELYDDSQAELWGNSTAKLYDNSTAELYDNSTAKLFGDSQAELYNDSQAKLCGNSQAVLWNNSTAKLFGDSQAVLYNDSQAKLWGYSTAELWDNSTGIIPYRSIANAEKSTLHDNAVLIDRKNKKIITACDSDYVLE